MINKHQGGDQSEENPRKKLKKDLKYQDVKEAIQRIVVSKVAQKLNIEERLLFTQ